MSERDELRERVARAICAKSGYNPDDLEPGDDAYMDNGGVWDKEVRGQKCHHMWRYYVQHADAAIAIVLVEAAQIVRPHRSYTQYRDGTIVGDPLTSPTEKLRDQLADAILALKEPKP